MTHQGQVTHLCDKQICPDPSPRPRQYRLLLQHPCPEWANRHGVVHQQGVGASSGPGRGLVHPQPVWTVDQCHSAVHRLQQPTAAAARPPRAVTCRGSRADSALLRAALDAEQPGCPGTSSGWQRPRYPPHTPPPLCLGRLGVGGFGRAVLPKLKDASVGRARAPLWSSSWKVPRALRFHPAQ